jgi:alpha-L-rhamnosidase
MTAELLAPKEGKKIPGWFRLYPLVLLMLGGCNNAARIAPANARTEYMVDPSGLGTSRPRFSWTLQAADPQDRGLRETAYQVRVRTADGSGGPAMVLWDTGEVASDSTSQVVYGGRPLASGQACTWCVRARDQYNAWSEWSAPARWSTGPLSEKDWSAQWIGTGESNPAVAPENLLPDPWFRRDLELSARPARAVAYVASVGFHELYVNGRKMGDSVLMPSVTDNSQRARYVTYEIADYLHEGVNTIGLWLGTGWSISKAFATADKPRAPIVMAQFDIAMPDGSTRRIGTDAGWRTHPSPSTLLGAWTFMNYGGELYDANKEIPDWASPGFDASGWKLSAVFAPALKVSAERDEPNRLEAEIQAVAVTEPQEGVYRFDMGRNFTGWVVLHVAGRPGDRIDLQFSERAEAPMTYRIRSAYIVGPSGSGSFRNRFNYGVGRWITVKGLRAKPALDDIRGWLVRTDYARASAFECSDPLLNRIYDTTLWTIENLSLGGYMVDCPHRERMGYGGDAHATTATALMNFRTDAFYTKWAEDWRDVQSTGKAEGRKAVSGGAVPGDLEAGNLPYTAPTYWGGGGPVWSGYCVHLPWELYRRTGDLRILDESFGTIQRWLGFLETKASADLLRRWGGDWDFLGDWLWPGAKGMNNDSRETLFLNNCYWIYNLSAASEIARLLGRDEQAAAWAKRSDEVRRAVNREFFNAADCSYVNGGEAYLAVALMANVPAPESRAGVWKRLEDEILVNRKGHIYAGITGGALLFKTLIEAHRDDLLYAMVGQPDYPGWGDLLKRGETTFGESWDGHDSLLHSSYLYAGAWFINGVLGIQPAAGGGGFQRFTIRPGPIDRPALIWARGHYDSLQGRIEVSWRRLGDSFELDATVPANTSASVYLPIGPPGSLTESGRPLSGAAGVQSVSVDEDHTVVSVGSGTYHFAAALVRPAPP